jgi:mannan endo-1,4-beta-mannosidase
VQSTARLIKSLAPNHLVCTGSEGLKGTLERTDIYLEEHRLPEIDYCTAHIWPLNWELDRREEPGGHQRSRAAEGS